MANLNGVKVIDMVGGEITKVAYDGAEYVKVGGDAQVGNLIRIAKTGCDVEVDDFYNVKGLDEDGDAKIVDRAGDYRGIFTESHNLFRKVSAKPAGSTVETRLDDVESRLTVLEQSAEPTQELKAGDFVTIDTCRYRADITTGKAYEVLANSDGDLYFIDDDNDERFDPLLEGAYTIVEAPAPEFKVGDIVVITGNTNASRNAVGDIGKIVDAVNNNAHSVSVLVPGKEASNGNGNYTKPSEMRHATPAERQAYEDPLKPKLKAGDYVKFTEDDRDITAGKKYEVKTYEDRELYFVDDDGDKRFAALEWESCEITDAPKPPTAFERAGRKEGEFKVGDVVRVSTRADAHKVAGSLVTIAEFKEGGNCGGLAWFEDYGRSITGQYLELIAPVESRVDATNRGEASCA